MKLPEEISTFISRKIELENYCLPHFYPEPDNIEKFQEGYKFNSITGEDFTGENEGDFKKNWYVICSDYANDPFFIDITEQTENYPVYFAWHGAGKWEPIKIAENITAFSDKLELLTKVETEQTGIQEKIRQYIDLENDFWKEVYCEYEDYEEDEQS